VARPYASRPATPNKPVYLHYIEQMFFYLPSTAPQSTSPIAPPLSTHSPTPYHTVTQSQSHFSHHPRNQLTSRTCMLTTPKSLPLFLRSFSEAEAAGIESHLWLFEREMPRLGNDLASYANICSPLVPAHHQETQSAYLSQRVPKPHAPLHPFPPSYV